MNKAYKYRIYPTAKQSILFAKTFGCCRKVYNLMLSDKIKSYKETGHFGSQTPAQYKNDYPYLREVDSLALSNVQLNLQEAMNKHFNKKYKKRTGFPRFKSKKNSRKSYTTNNQKGRTGTYSIVIIDKSHIKIPKVGAVKVEIHRLPPSDWMLKSVTISQEGDGTFYMSVLFEYQDNIVPVPISDNAIGLDYASDGLYVDSNGNIGTNHKYFRESQKKLAKAQRILSRRKGSKKGEEKSKNYLKQLQKVNKIHRHIANQRRDNLNKISTKIANQYDIVCIESLNMKSMSNKDFGNGKATMDNGYGLFCKMLEYKLADRGKYLVKVDKWYPSSQLCSKCGTKHPEMKDLTVRVMNCNCGFVLDRDWNAAINIKDEGLRLLASM